MASGSADRRDDSPWWTYDIGIKELIQVGDEWNIDSRKGKWDFDFSSLRSFPLHRFLDSSKIKRSRNLLHLAALDRLGRGLVNRGRS
jgi:hypothetical protein